MLLKSLLLILRCLGPFSGPSNPPSCTQLVHKSPREERATLLLGCQSSARNPAIVWDQFPERGFSVQSGCALENAQERDQVRFLLRREHKAKAALVKLHGIQQSLSGSVMEIRGAG